MLNHINLYNQNITKVFHRNFFYFFVFISYLLYNEILISKDSNLDNHDVKSPSK